MIHGDLFMNYKILHVFPSFALAGQQVRFCDIVNSQINNVEHIVIALDNNYDAFCRVNNVECVGQIHFVFRDKKFNKRIADYLTILKIHKTDLLITYNWGATEFIIANFIFRHCPMVHIEDGFNVDERDKQKIRRVLARRFLFTRIKKLIVPSKTLERIAIDSWRQRPEKIQYIPNGIDLSYYKKTHVIKPSDAPVTIGTVASVRTIKRLDRLINCFKQLNCDQPIRLSIVGDGDVLPQLKALAVGDERIVFHGFQKDPRAFIEEMDIFALTSDSEQMPYTVLEAMALGKPVVSTDVGDIKNMVSHENKPFVVPLEKNNQLISAFNLLISEPQLRHSIGEKNYLKCHKEYSVESMIAAHLKTYLQAINHSKPL